MLSGPKIGNKLITIIIIITVTNTGRRRRNYIMTITLLQLQNACNLELHFSEIDTCN